MRLSSYLLHRIVLSGAIALLVVLSWLVAAGHQSARAELEGTAAAVASILTVQLIGMTQIEGLEPGFPYWYPVAQVARPDGSCVRLFADDGALLRSSCSGRAEHRLLAPQWFVQFYSFVFEPEKALERKIENSNRSATVQIIPDGDVEILAAWQTVKGIVTPAALLIGVLCLTVWWAVRRALKPARAIMLGLAEIENGDFNSNLGPYPWVEFDRIAGACNTLAGSLSHTTAARNALSRRLLNVQEQERQALARELHDEFGQHLSAVSASAAALRGSVDDKIAREDVRRIEDSAAYLMQLVRERLVGLRPWSAEGAELPESLRALATRRTTSEGHQPRIDFDLPAHLDDLPPLLSAAIYRIVQEALTNALRHGEPKLISVKLVRSATQIEISVRDDGRGCDEEALRQGFGIAGIHERVSALGGRATFTRNSDGGLSVDIVFPNAANDPLAA